MKLSEMAIGQRITPCKAACCLSIEKLNPELFHIIDANGNRIEATPDEILNFSKYIVEDGCAL